MRPTIVAIAAAALLATGSVASTQQSPILIQCAWEQGGTDTYRVTASTWQFWNADTWSWQEMRCIGSETGEQGMCTIGVTDTDMAWRLRARTGGEARGSAYINERQNLIINRLTGRAMLSINLTIDRGARYRDGFSERHTQDFAQCTPAKDPALTPKPAPPPPPRPKF